MATPGIPFAWHFKEGVFICLEMETRPQLIDLHRYSDGQIFSSLECGIGSIPSFPACR